MTQEDKDLLFKDLCGRLPYGVKVEIYNHWRDDYEDETLTLENYSKLINTFSIGDIKPYLFPLSSMTEEQEKEISKRYNYYHYYGTSVEITNHREGFWDNDNSCLLEDYLWLEDWYNKNHIDYRGLIPMGLAENASGKNIY